jgi:hypothetical protein
MAYTFVISVSPLIDVLARALSITLERSPVLCVSLLVVLRSSCHQRMVIHKHLLLINIASVTLTVALVKPYFCHPTWARVMACYSFIYIQYLYKLHTQVLILFQIP